MNVANSEREKYRSDFSTEFLNDFADQATNHGNDPYNLIGLNAGQNNPRALQIWGDRATGLGFAKDSIPY